MKISSYSSMCASILPAAASGGTSSRHTEHAPRPSFGAWCQPQCCAWADRLRTYIVQYIYIYRDSRIKNDNRPVVPVIPISTTSDEKPPH